VRVATALAGANWGGHFIPRIGQEVLVQFTEGDIDRPVVVGAVYNGRGQDNAQGNRFAASVASATANAPVFFPGTAQSGPHQGHAHAAVLVGFKTQALDTSQSGFGAHNTLIFDLSPDQSRLQLATTQATSELSLGHLIHPHDNQRLAKRGHGLDLSTAAYGAVRAAQGLLLSTDLRPSGTGTQLDSREARTRLSQAVELATTLATSARDQQAKLANEAEPKAQPMRKALDRTIESLDSTDVRDQQTVDDSESEESFIATRGGAGTVTAYARPDLVLASPGGVGLFTPAHSLCSAGHTLSVIAGQDVNLSSGRNTAINVAKGIVLYTYGKAQNAKKPNTETGMKLHAGAGSVAVYAAKDKLDAAADKAVDIASVTKAVNITAPKKHVLLTAGGSYLKIEGGTIELGTSGSARFEAAMKNLTSGASVSASASTVKGTLKGCSMRLSAAEASGAALVQR
jgi:type VI secretion system secreted protein VgrG